MKRLLIIGVSALFLIGLIGLTGCAASPPYIQHLQLSAGSIAAPTRDGPVIVVDAIALPDYLLRDELLRRDSDYVLHYDGLRRWAEPLDLGIQRILSQRLKSALNTRQVVQFPKVPALPAGWVLRVSLTNFETQDNRVTLNAEGRWELAEDPGVTFATVSFSESLPLNTGSAEAAAQNMSQLLWHFADELADSLKQTTTADSNPL